jgi:hypothetical protein
MSPTTQLAGDVLLSLAQSGGSGRPRRTPVKPGRFQDATDEGEAAPIGKGKAASAASTAKGKAASTGKGKAGPTGKGKAASAASTGKGKAAPTGKGKAASTGKGKADKGGGPAGRGEERAEGEGSDGIGDDGEGLRTGSGSEGLGTGSGSEARRRSTGADGRRSPPVNTLNIFVKRIVLNFMLETDIFATCAKPPQGKKGGVRFIYAIGNVRGIKSAVEAHISTNFHNWALQ